MIRIRPIAAAASVAAICALPAMSAPADAAKKKKVTCTKRSGDTIYRDASLRVFQIVKGVKGDSDASTVTINFCTPGSKAKPKRLTGWSNSLDGAFTIDAVHRAGPDHLVLDTAYSSGTVDAEELEVYRLSTQEHTFTYGSEDAPFTFAVTTGGGVALLENGVLKVYDGAGERQVATGADRVASSGDTVYWTAGGAAASTVLTGEGKKSNAPS